MKPEHAYQLKLVVILFALIVGTYELYWILQYHGMSTRLAVFLATTKIGAATLAGALAVRFHHHHRRGDHA